MLWTTPTDAAEEHDLDDPRGHRTGACEGSAKGVHASSSALGEPAHIAKISRILLPRYRHPSRTDAGRELKKREEVMRKPFPCLWFDGKAEEAADAG